MKSSTWRTDTMLGIAGVLSMLLVWEFFARWNNSTLLPYPTSISKIFLREVRSGNFVETISSSLWHYWIGSSIGCGLGIFLAGLTATYRSAGSIFAGIAALLRPIPPLAWTPFALLWLGISQAAAAFLISIGAFWITYYATHDAIRTVSPAWMELAEAFGHRSRLAKLWKVGLPASSVTIFSSIRTALGQSWMFVVGAELLGIRGIGQRMWEASGLLQMELVVTYMFTLALLYTVTDVSVRLLERKILVWVPR